MGNMVKYPSVKHIATTVLLLLASIPAIAARVDVPPLPPAPYADMEAATNVALNVNAARLEKLTLSVTFDTCETNEVLVAIGADTDGNGDLSFDESALLYGCDCGAWYRADLRTGATGSADANGLVIGKGQFDPAWNIVKVIRRGFGEIGESVSMDEERVKFDIRIR